MTSRNFRRKDPIFQLFLVTHTDCSCVGLEAMEFEQTFESELNHYSSSENAGHTLTFSIF